MNSCIDSAHGGTGWIERSTSNIEEIGKIWEICGVSSETDPLRHVLLKKPGKELYSIDNPSNILWTKKMDYEKALYQHEQLAQVYRENGVLVTHIETGDQCEFPNLIYVRDTFTMTPQGVILSRLASKIRAGEEKIVAASLSAMGIPIIATPINNMKIEGPDILIVNSDLVFLGVGLRTNIEAIQYVSMILKLQGFSDIVIIQTTYGCGHLDGVVNLINSKYAAIVPQRASYTLYEELKKHGYSIVELINKSEIDSYMSINFVSVNEETLIINQGANEAIKLYNKCGVRCIETDVSELTNGGGSVHCMTGVIWRKK